MIIEAGNQNQNPNEHIIILWRKQIIKKNFTPRVADTRIKFIIKKIVISSFLFRAVVDDSFIY